MENKKTPSAQAVLARHFIDAMATLKEKERLQIMDALLKITLEGSFCDDKQPMAIIKNLKDGREQFIKLSQLKRLTKFQESNRVC